MAFASNKNAYGICDITGFRYKRKDMKKTWDGLQVGPDQWDAKHPQLQPSAPPSEPEAIKDARDVSIVPSAFTVYTNVGLGIIGTVLTTPTELTASLGDVTITT